MLKKVGSGPSDLVAKEKVNKVLANNVKII
jgi:hypothetical protein